MERYSDFLKVPNPIVETLALEKPLTTPGRVSRISMRCEERGDGSLSDDSGTFISVPSIHNGSVVDDIDEIRSEYETESDKPINVRDLDKSKSGMDESDLISKSTANETQNTNISVEKPSSAKKDIDQLMQESPPTKRDLHIEDSDQLPQSFNNQSLQQKEEPENSLGVVRINDKHPDSSAHGDRESIHSGNTHVSGKESVDIVEDKVLSTNNTDDEGSSTFLESEEISCFGDDESGSQTSVEHWTEIKVEKEVMDRIVIHKPGEEPLLNLEVIGQISRGEISGSELSDKDQSLVGGDRKVDGNHDDTRPSLITVDNGVTAGKCVLKNRINEDKAFSKEDKNIHKDELCSDNTSVVITDKDDNERNVSNINKVSTIMESSKETKGNPTDTGKTCSDNNGGGVSRANIIDTDESVDASEVGDASCSDYTSNNSDSSDESNSDSDDVTDDETSSVQSTNKLAVNTNRKVDSGYSELKQVSPMSIHTGANEIKTNVVGNATNIKRNPKSPTSLRSVNSLNKKTSGGIMNQQKTDTSNRLTLRRSGGSNAEESNARSAQVIVNSNRKQKISKREHIENLKKVYKQNLKLKGTRSKDPSSTDSLPNIRTPRHVSPSYSLRQQQCNLKESTCILDKTNQSSATKDRLNIVNKKISRENETGNDVILSKRRPSGQITLKENVIDVKFQNLNSKDSVPIIQKDKTPQEPPITEPSIPHCHSHNCQNHVKRKDSKAHGIKDINSFHGELTAICNKTIDKSKTSVTSLKTQQDRRLELAMQEMFALHGSSIDTSDGDISAATKVKSERKYVKDKCNAVEPPPHITQALIVDMPINRVPNQDIAASRPSGTRSNKINHTPAHTSKSNSRIQHKHVTNANVRLISDNGNEAEHTDGAKTKTKPNTEGNGSYYTDDLNHITNNPPERQENGQNDKILGGQYSSAACKAYHDKRRRLIYSRTYRNFYKNVPSEPNVASQKKTTHCVKNLKRNQSYFDSVRPIDKISVDIHTGNSGKTFLDRNGLNISAYSSATFVGSRHINESCSEMHCKGTMLESAASVHQRDSDCENLSIVGKETQLSNVQRSTTGEETTRDERSIVGEETLAKDELSIVGEKTLTKDDLPIVAEKTSSRREQFITCEESCTNDELSIVGDKTPSSKDERSVVHEKTVANNKRPSVCERTVANNELSIVGEKTPLSNYERPIVVEKTVAKDELSIVENTLANDEQFEVQGKSQDTRSDVELDTGHKMVYPKDSFASIIEPVLETVDHQAFDSTHEVNTTEARTKRCTSYDDDGNEVLCCILQAPGNAVDPSSFTCEVVDPLDVSPMVKRHELLISHVIKFCTYNVGHIAKEREMVAKIPIAHFFVEPWQEVVIREVNKSGHWIETGEDVDIVQIPDMGNVVYGVQIALKELTYVAVVTRPRITTVTLEHGSKIFSSPSDPRVKLRVPGTSDPRRVSLQSIPITEAIIKQFENTRGPDITSYISAASPMVIIHLEGPSPESFSFAVPFVGVDYVGDYMKEIEALIEAEKVKSDSDEDKGDTPDALKTNAEEMKKSSAKGTIEPEEIPNVPPRVRTRLQSELENKPPIQQKQTEAQTKFQELESKVHKREKERYLIQLGEGNDRSIQIKLLDDSDRIKSMDIEEKCEEEERVKFSVYDTYARLFAVEIHDIINFREIQSTVKGLANYLLKHRVRIDIRQDRNNLFSVKFTASVDQPFRQRWSQENQKKSTEVSSDGVRFLEMNEGDAIGLAFRGNIEVTNQAQRIFCFHGYRGIDATFDLVVRDAFSQKTLPKFHGAVQVYTLKRPRMMPICKTRVQNVSSDWDLLTEYHFMLPKYLKKTPIIINRAPISLRFQEPLTVDFVRQMCKELIKDWDTFAFALGISNARIQAIKQHNRNQISDRVLMDIIVCWMKQQPIARDKVGPILAALRICKKAHLENELKQRHKALKDTRTKTARDKHIQRAALALCQSRTVTVRWRQLLGYLLHLETDDIKICDVTSEIDEKYKNDATKCFHALLYWKSISGTPSIWKVVDALRHLNCPVAANTLRVQEYKRLY